MNFEAKSNRRLILKNSALVLGGLFVSGKIIAQTMPSGPTGSPTNPTLPNTNQPPTSPMANPNQTGNTGLYQQNYTTGSITNGTNQNNRMFSSTYSSGYYGAGYYGAGFYGGAGYHGTGYR